MHIRGRRWAQLAVVASVGVFGATSIAGPASAALNCGSVDMNPDQCVQSISDTAGQTTSGWGAATDSVQATYWDENGNLIGTTPASVTPADTTGVDSTYTTDPFALSSVPTTPTVDTPTADILSTPVCSSGHVCGNPTYQGCGKWQVWRTQYDSTGVELFRFHVDVYYCWKNHVINTSSLNVSTYVTDESYGVQDNGNVENNEYYYQYWSGIDNSGHASQVERHISYCAFKYGCYQDKYPWIHEYVHGDGTMYFHTGD
jgi:hypothetical protein